MLSKHISQRHKRRYYSLFDFLFLVISSQVLYASREILIGDEINDCYIELRQSTAQRRDKLQEIYRFHCECPACCEYDLSLINLNQLKLQSDHNEPRSFPPDEAREKAMQLDQQILTMAEDGQPPHQILLLAQELLALLQSSACRGWKERYLGEVHLSIYHLAMTLSDMEGENPEMLMKSSSTKKKNTTNPSRRECQFYEMAVEHLLLAHQWNRILQGPDSPDSVNTQSYCQLHRCLTKRALLVSIR